MFDVERFIEDCKSAVKESSNHTAVRELVAEAVSNPNDVLNGLGAPDKAGLNTLYQSDDLTILNLVWGPGMSLPPHNHEMWAVIGIYSGREDNIFWRRVAGDENGRVEAAGAKELCTGDCAPLGKDIIHSVTNPIQKLTGALHVYGGDFFEAERSEWNPESLLEGPLDVERTRAAFETSNRITEMMNKL